MERVAKDGTVYRQVGDDEWEPIGQSQAAPKGRPGEAALQGFGNAATMGFLPDLQAATYPAMEKGLSFVTGKKVEPENEEGLLTEFVGRQESLKNENPMAYGAGSVAGTAATLRPAGSAIKGSRAGKATIEAGKKAFGKLSKGDLVEAVLNPTGSMAKKAWGLLKGAAKEGIEEGGKAVAKSPTSISRAGGERAKDWFLKTRKGKLAPTE